MSNFIRNLEALLLDEADAVELQNSSTVEEKTPFKSLNPSFQSLNFVAAVEQ